MKYGKVYNVIAVILPTIVLLMMSGELIMRYPSNHGGGFYCYAFPIIVAMAIGMVNRFLIGNSICAILLSISCLLLMILSDWFNLYVEYDVWLRRGMPEFGTPCVLCSSLTRVEVANGL